MEEGQPACSSSRLSLDEGCKHLAKCCPSFAGYVLVRRCWLESTILDFEREVCGGGRTRYARVFGGCVDDTAVWRNPRGVLFPRHFCFDVEVTPTSLFTAATTF